MHQNIRNNIQNYNRGPKEHLEKTKVSQRCPLMILSVCDILGKPCTSKFLSASFFFTCFMNGFHCLFGKTKKKKKELEQEFTT